MVDGSTMAAKMLVFIRIPMATAFAWWKAPRGGEAVGRGPLRAGGGVCGVERSVAGHGHPGRCRFHGAHLPILACTNAAR
jgi:hypothetical protein